MDLKNAIKSLGFFYFLFFCFTVHSQEIKDVTRCATDEYNKALLKKYPEMMGSSAFEKKLANSIQLQSAQNANRRVVYTIPVVVHVVHNGEPIGTGPNISDDQVLSQIQVLNEDFRRLFGTRGYNTHPDGADVEVEFCLAKQTPDGCTTNGINRIDMSDTATSWSGPGGNTDTVLKPATYWDASRYFNIWSVQFSNTTLLGFAQFPNGPASSDGVVIGYQFFGSSDDPNVTLPNSTFDLGRTGTQEVGHYLGLFHTFQGGCSETGGGDQCADTPPVANGNSNNSTCNPGNDSCTVPPGFPDMVENYMDYSSDVCMNVFTNDQKSRMVATLTTAPNRPNTTTSTVCNNLPSVSYDVQIGINSIATEDCISTATPSIIITNWGTTTLTSADITHDVDGGTPSVYNWSGSLAFGEYEVVTLPGFTGAPGNRTFNATVSNPNGNSDARVCNDVTSAPFTIPNSFASTTQVHLTLNTDDYGGETTWEFRNSGGTLLNSGGPYLDNATINESFNVSTDECYTFTIFDSANDGICCGYGVGSYELKADDNTVIASGGEFGGSESKKISTITLGADEYFSNNRISIYPNPVSNLLHVKLGNGNDLPDAFEVYNILGQSMMRQNVGHISDLELDVSLLSNGMYFIKVIKEGNAITLPFIKK